MFWLCAIIDLPPNAKSQICAIMCVKEPNIVLDFVQVQEQHGYCDFGMFAIAFTISLYGGHNPAESTIQTGLSTASPT